MISYCELFAIREYIMFEALLAASSIALLSLLGAFIFRRHNHITGTHRFIVPIALGMFLGIVFFELIPETLHASEFGGPVAIVVGFLAFYLLSHILRTYHHHHHDHCDDCVPKSSAYMLLIGDAVHNIADGIVIATAFIVDPALGIAATIGVGLHEIPQEIAEYGVLIQAGYSRGKAALFNLLSASSIILGVLVSFAFLHLGDYLWVLTGIAAGNLLYLAASDMIPELHGDQHRGHFLSTFISTILGLLIIVALLQAAHGDQHHEDEDHDESEQGELIAH